MRWYDLSLQHARERAAIERAGTKLLARDRARRRRQRESDARRNWPTDVAPVTMPASGKWLPLSELERALRSKGR